MDLGEEDEEYLKKEWSLTDLNLDIELPPEVNLIAEVEPIIQPRRNARKMSQLSINTEVDLDKTRRKAEIHHTRHRQSSKFAPYQRRYSYKTTLNDHDSGRTSYPSGNSMFSSATDQSSLFRSGSTADSALYTQPSTGDTNIISAPELQLHNYEFGPGWTASLPPAMLYTEDRIEYQAHLTTRIDRGFFLSNKDWICYRRNFFQLSAAFQIRQSETLEPTNTPLFIFIAPEKPMRVIGYYVQLSAEIMGEGRPIYIKQHASKRNVNARANELVKHRIIPGGDINYALNNPAQVTTMERLHFQTATHNNGRKKQQQQYFQLTLRLVASLEGGEEVMIGESKSAPLIVRGRGPGHYVEKESMENEAAFASERFQRGPDTAGIDGSLGWDMPTLSIGGAPPLSAPILGTNEIPISWNAPVMGNSSEDLLKPTNHIPSFPKDRMLPTTSSQELMSPYQHLSADFWPGGLSGVDTDHPFQALPLSPVSILTNQFGNNKLLAPKSRDTSPDRGERLNRPIF